jgi:hypothetical protein
MILEGEEDCEVKKVSARTSVEATPEVDEVKVFENSAGAFR